MNEDREGGERGERGERGSSADQINSVSGDRGMVQELRKIIPRRTRAGVAPVHMRNC